MKITLEDGRELNLELEDGETLTYVMVIGHVQRTEESGIVYDSVDSFGDAPSNVVTAGLIEYARDAVKGGFND